MKPPFIEVKSSTPSRTRLVVKGQDKDDYLPFVQLLVCLEADELVESVQANDRTGSVLVIHNDNELEILEQVSNLEIATVLYSGSPQKIEKNAVAHLRTVIREGLDGLDAQLKKYSGGELDLPSITAFILFGMSFYQTFKKNRFLPAGEALLAAGMRMMVDKNIEES